MLHRYKEGGPAAEARFEAGVAGYEARAFRGCGVFTSEPFEVSDDADSVQMLTRSSQIGEFYTMMPPQVQPTGKGDAPGLYTSDMLIYDEESDKHVRITWSDALAATMVNELSDESLVSEGFKGNKKLRSSTSTTEITWQYLALMVESYNTNTNKANIDYRTETEKAKTGPDALPAGGPPTHAALFKMGALDIRIVVARPFIEHLMHNVILAVSGRETGATLFGPADMQLSANTQVKTIEGALRACAHTPLRLAPMVLPTPPPAAERANCGAQATTPATSRPW